MGSKTKVTDNDMLFQEPEATQLACMRIKARGKRQITYDCMNAVVQGSKALCKLGHKFLAVGRDKVTGREIGMSLRIILRGRSSSACTHCPDYDGECDE